MKKFEYLGLAVLLGVWEISFKTEWLSIVAGLGSVGYLLAFLWHSGRLWKHD